MGVFLHSTEFLLELSVEGRQGMVEEETDWIQLFRLTGTDGRDLGVRHAHQVEAFPRSTSPPEPTSSARSTAPESHCRLSELGGGWSVG